MWLDCLSRLKHNRELGRWPFSHLAQGPALTTCLTDIRQILIMKQKILSGHRDSTELKKRGLSVRVC